jgi:hypothetical protein
MDTLFSSDVDKAFGFSTSERQTEFYFGTVYSVATKYHTVILDCAPSPIMCRAGCDAAKGDTVVVMVPKCGRPCTISKLS